MCVYSIRKNNLKLPQVLHNCCKGTKMSCVSIRSVWTSLNELRLYLQRT